MKLSGFMQQFGVTLDTCACIAIATDGYKSDSNPLMLALETFDGTEMSVFVKGGDVVSTQQFHGIPKKVYDDLAVEPELAAEVLKRKMEEFGISNLVGHTVHRFLQPVLHNAKLIDNSTSFIDIQIFHKGLQFWPSNAADAAGLQDLHTKIEHMRGKNQISLNKLVEYYGVKDREPPSPYIPVNKANQVKGVFEILLDTELPF